MARSILLTDKHTPLGSHLAQKFLEAGEQVTGLIKGSLNEALPGEEAEEELKLLPWNQTSPISVHNVLVDSVNTMGKIDDAVFLFQPEIDNKPLHELNLKTIDSYVDTYIKGSLFLLREILNYFQKQQKGSLFIVLDNPGMEVLAPVDSMSLQGLEAFTNTLFTLYQNEDININGFASNVDDDGQYADFIYTTIIEKARQSHGKWYRFGERSVWNALGFSSKNR